MGENTAAGRARLGAARRPGRAEWGVDVPHAEYGVVIKRPVTEVFAYVIDGTTGPSWRPSVSDIRLVAGTPGQVGARYEQGMRGGPGGRIPADYELTEVVPDRRIVFKVVAGPARPEGRYDSPPRRVGRA